MRSIGFLSRLSIAVFLLAPLPTLAQSLVTEDLRIPDAEAGSQGLEAVLVKPSGAGRHPLVVLSHGSPRDGNDRAKLSARDMLAEAVVFAKRGFVAVAVLRRGYGTSPGGWAETYGPCDKADYASAGRRGAADVKTAILFLEKRGDVEASNVLAVGVSAGGFATVALTADPPPGLVAAISFAGGRGSSGPDTVCSGAALVEAFGQYGARSRTPMLWVYAQNDHFFGPALAQRLLAAFNGAGGQADFVHAPAFGDEGHFLFSAKGEAVWTPIVDTYLKTHGFALAALAQNASPALAPPRQISASGRKDFETYLAAPGHKAFAVSESGAYAWRTARGTADEAKETALHNCADLGKKPCALYAVDDAYARKGRD